MTITKRLEGRIALVTGGGTGIGSAIAQLFAREGACVVVAGRRKAPLEDTVNAIVAEGGSAALFTADVAVWEQTREMVAFAVTTFGGLDTLVTSAGIVRRTEVVEETTEDEWDQLINTNLKGVFSTIKFALPIMISQKRGSIVTLSSIGAHYAATGYATYSASKGGVSALTRCIALQYASAGVRANCVCPGMVHTPMAYVDRPEPFDEMVDNIVRQHYPLQRVAVPDDVAKAALFLASDESSYITGHELFVNGGFTIK